MEITGILGCRLLWVTGLREILGWRLLGYWVTGVEVIRLLGVLEWGGTGVLRGY